MSSARVLALKSVGERPQGSEGRSECINLQYKSEHEPYPMDIAISIATSNILLKAKVKNGVYQCTAKLDQERKEKESSGGGDAESANEAGRSQLPPRRQSITERIRGSFMK